jgi:hypothetical protein
MSIILGVDTKVNPQDIFDGSIITMPPIQEALDLLDHARKIAEDVFGQSLDEIEERPGDDPKLFISYAHQIKTRFTDGADTQELTKALIRARYPEELLQHMIYDKPRMRIIPNSNFLSTGISYNYKPHRDTWYNGGVQEQLNHWMPLCNAGVNSTFFMAPSYYNKPVENNSEIFDVDVWDQKFRKQADKMLEKEERPHPVPIHEMPAEDKYLVVMPVGYELAFSGHHFHGSGENTTSKVRFSLDYRTIVQLDGYTYPENIDCKATGDLRTQYLPV